MGNTNLNMDVKKPQSLYPVLLVKTQNKLEGVTHTHRSVLHSLDKKICAL